MKGDAFEHPKGEEDIMGRMTLRGGLGFTCLAALAAAFAAGTVAMAACSSDSPSGASSSLDGSTVDVNQPPPPPPSTSEPSAPTDLLSRVPGFLGNATQIADVGEPTDGPSWHDDDGALYFTVPGSTSPLRRVVPGGTVEIVPYPDGGSNPAGLATGGGGRIFATEREAIVTLDIDDAGAVAATSRTSGPGGTVFGDIAVIAPGPSAYFVDTSSPRVYRFIAPSDLSLISDLPDAGRTTGLAVRAAGGTLEIYVAESHTNGGNGGSGVLVLRDDSPGPGLVVGTEIDLKGIPANGIAVDTEGRIMVAWARGIDVFTMQSESPGPQDGFGMLPIRAVPTSLAFGGADRMTLFVTTATGKIYSVPVSTAGVPR
jgi:sugar lactone lactonase YvrE